MPKKVVVVEVKIIIARVQRQKRKFVTTVVGLDTVPGNIIICIIFCI